MRTHFPERTLRTTVPRSVRISEAPSYGQTVMTYDPSSSGALAYLEAARELADRGAAADGAGAAPGETGIGRQEPGRRADDPQPRSGAHARVDGAPRTQRPTPIGWSSPAEGTTSGGTPAPGWDDWRSAGKEEW